MIQFQLFKLETLLRRRLFSILHIAIIALPLVVPLIGQAAETNSTCLLYTSDAADDYLTV